MLHQFYFTHCTYGTSALERKTGETAPHALGYSVRSGSLQGPALRDIFRKLERYVYYYLPSDTQVLEKESLTASAAPKRLIFLPDTECGPVLMQLVYRPKDTAGRIGSYFAHVLTSNSGKSGKPQPPGGPAQSGSSALNSFSALQLWNAQSWVLEDAAWFPYDIAPVSSTADFLSNMPPAIDERVLTSFLKTEAGGNFYDPKNLIPERWKKMLLSERQHYFKTLLYGFLSKYDSAGESLLLVVEPEIAALLFYGVCLFFPSTFTRNLSFSTYEPNPERLFTKLAATVFRNPESDLSDAVYCGNSFVLNTWNGRTSNFSPALMTESYVGQVWKQFLAGGIPQVQAFCQTFSTVGAATATDLKALMEVEKIFHRILADDEGKALSEAPGTKPLPLSFQSLPMASSRMAVTLLKRRLAEGITKIMAKPLPEAEKELGRTQGTPGQLLLLELLGVGGNVPEVQRAVRFLAETLPEKWVGQWLKTSSAGDDFKAQILNRWLKQTGTLPSGCGFLWKLSVDSIDVSKGFGGGLDSNSNLVPGPKPPAANAGILPGLLLNLSLEQLLKIFQSENVQKNQKEMILTYTLGVVRLVEREGALSESVLAIRKNLDQFIQEIPESVFGAIYKTYGNWFFLNYPGDSLFLGEKFTCLEADIFQKPADISAKMEILFDIQDILPEAVAGRVRKWKRLQKAIQAVTSFQIQAGQKGQIKTLEQACESLAQTAYDLFDDARFFARCGGPKASEFARVGKISAKQRVTFSEKEMELLALLCRQWFAVDFLPEGPRIHAWMRKKMKFYFQTKNWNAAKMNALGSQAFILMILGGIGIGLLAVLLFFLCFTNSKSQEGQDNFSESESSATDFSDQTKQADQLNEGEGEDEDSKSASPRKRKSKKSSSPKSSIKSRKGSKTASGKDSALTEDGLEAEENELAPKEEVYEMESSESGDGEGTADSEISDEMAELENAEGAAPDSGIDGEKAADGTESGDSVSEIRAAEKTGTIFEKTPKETLDQWDLEMEKDGMCRRTFFETVPTDTQPVDDSLCVLAVQKTIQEAGGFTSNEMEGIALRGGYVLFEGTAYPFGKNPDCVTAPKKAESDNFSAVAPEGTKKKRRHVLKAEDLEKKPVEEESASLCHLPELAETLGFESVWIKMEKNTQDAQTLYLYVQRKLADAGKRAERKEIEENLEVKQKQIENLESVFKRCQLHQQKRNQKLMDALTELAELMGKRTFLAVPEVSDPENQEQIEARRRAEERVFVVKMPQLFELAKDRLNQWKAEVQQLQSQLPDRTGWTPAELAVVRRFQTGLTPGTEESREVAEVQGPQVCAVFSGNFFFNLPLPIRAEKVLAKARGENSSTENSDPFGEESVVSSTGIQPLTQEEIGTQVLLLEQGNDFEMDFKPQPFRSKKDSSEKIEIECSVRKLQEELAQLQVTIQLRQIVPGEKNPIDQTYSEVQNGPVQLDILPEAQYLLLAFQIQKKVLNVGEKESAPPKIYISPYCQICLSDESGERNGEASADRQKRNWKVRFTLTPETALKILEKEEKRKRSGRRR